MPPKASNSFNRRRYEMVCVPRSLLLFCRLSCSPARWPGATVVPDFDHITVTPCHIPELHEDRRNSEDEDEDEDKEVYVLRGITLLYIDYVRSCSHSKVIILHRGRKGL